MLRVLSLLSGSPSYLIPPAFPPVSLTHPLPISTPDGTGVAFLLPPTSPQPSLDPQHLLNLTDTELGRYYLANRLQSIVHQLQLYIRARIPFARIAIVITQWIQIVEFIILPLKCIL